MTSCNTNENTYQQDLIDIKEKMSKVKNIILVMSGKGGVGKSTIAVNLAAGLALNGQKIGLFDIDIHGPSVPLMTGVLDKQPVFFDDKIIPLEPFSNFKILSTGMLFDRKSPVIWRGPMKSSAMRQILKQTEWGELDYLVVDCPPGTGDEQLSIIQLVGKESKAVIVTTPQDVSFEDVRKSIVFCDKLNVPVIGVVENMAYFKCPACEEEHVIFSGNSAEKIKLEFDLPILARIPLEPAVSVSTDKGSPFIYFNDKKEEVSQKFRDIVDGVLNSSTKTKENLKMEKKRIAVPSHEGQLCMHFGHCSMFEIFDVEDKKIVDQKSETPPPHEPGVLPKWLSEEHDVNVILAGGMGSRAQSLFTEAGIKVVVGASTQDTKEAVEKYLKGELETGQNACDH
ncbi:MAG: chromosome partitioning protein ParA [Candidatus Muiribacterium halophilum]|uniref:Iron-sulfur cluster carrier protein n=1 Tax=Muiribacterium halophilum TaxID=2053465 RepID=A0A2N5ZA52_MUIH1|nr:MAG: chromosome partitioning protein ParA [Candidatus Muirbacterium halophilum]